jgi:hypothetical protein
MMVLVMLLAVTHAIDNGLGLRPPLGWRNFNAFYNPCAEFGPRSTQAMSSVLPRY